MATKKVTLSVPEELKQKTTLMFTFNSPDVSGMWTEYVPTAWKVVPFTVDAGQTVILEYTAKLSFAQAQIGSGGEVIPGVSINVPFNYKSTLTKQGPNYRFSPPVEDTKLKPNQIKAINDTNDFATISVELFTDGQKKVVLAGEKLRDDYSFLVEFRPIVQVYAISYYVENAMLEAEIREETPLWTFDFSKVDGKEFYLKEGSGSHLVIVPK